MSFIITDMQYIVEVAGMVVVMIMVLCVCMCILPSGHYHITQTLYCIGHSNTYICIYMFVRLQLYCRIQFYLSAYSNISHYTTISCDCRTRAGCHISKSQTVCLCLNLCYCQTKEKGDHLNHIYTDTDLTCLIHSFSPTILPPPLPTPFQPLPPNDERERDEGQI